jgi:hypothetical protein
MNSYKQILYFMGKFKIWMTNQNLYMQNCCWNEMNLKKLFYYKFKSRKVIVIKHVEIIKKWVFIFVNCWMLDQYFLPIIIISILNW